MLVLYRVRNKGMQILLSNSQAGLGRRVKQEQEETSRNHVQDFIPGSEHHDGLHDIARDRNARNIRLLRRMTYVQSPE